MILPLFLTAAIQVAWPAESWSSAQNLTAIEGAGVNDFHVDLSGAAWNPQTRRLWVCRNGPNPTTSKVWALAEDGLGSFVVDTRAGNRGEWTGFNDAEALTQADLSEDALFVLVEGQEWIQEYDVSTYGLTVLRRTWALGAHLPVSGADGSEGLAFVPDSFLIAQGFVDGAGVPRVSANGMGGLMFVGNQIGGRVYAFDLNRATGAFAFVGAYLTGASETAELAFDRSTGHLYALHGAGVNQVEVLSLASIPVGAERKLVPLLTYLPPTGMPAGTNLEGLAIVATADCASGKRSLFFTIDDGGSTSLVRFRQFACCENASNASTACAGDGSTSTACPCGNPGAARNGCANSQVSAGARLDASATSTPDVLELVSSGTPPSSYVVFATSTTLSATGSLFGDGVRCLAGAIVRLRTRNATAGVTIVGPSAGDPPIAFLSNASAGSTFHYQAFYRDASPSYCTLGTYNATNAQLVTW